MSMFNEYDYKVLANLMRLYFELSNKREHVCHDAQWLSVERVVARVPDAAQPSSDKLYELTCLDCGKIIKVTSYPSSQEFEGLGINIRHDIKKKEKS